ncbi:hypothetical protein AAE478_006802 [Parahypoxylon ruwenzoriense]
MLFKTTIISAVMLLFANQAMGATIAIPRAALIATDAYSACHCPNNCKKKSGSGCGYYAGPSSNSKVLKGKCNKPNSNPFGEIECIAT